MDHKTKDQLDRLLADGQVSGPEADAIFERVYATVAPRSALSRAVRRALLLASLAAAASFILVVKQPSLPATGSTEFRARGAGSPIPTLELVCLDGALAACPASSRLVFLLAGDRASGFLSAYAEPQAGKGETIWYFSNESGNPQLTEGDGTRPFDSMVALSGSHAPGRYRVHAFVTEQALGRKDMREWEARDERGELHKSFDLVVIGE